MAVQCIYCGKTLRDDARFCNNCGTPVPSGLPHAQVRPSGGMRNNPSTPGNLTNDFSRPPVEQRGSRPPIREQIAQQPTSRPPISSMQAEDLPTSPLMASPPLRPIPPTPMFAPTGNEQLPFAGQTSLDEVTQRKKYAPGMRNPVSSPPMTPPPLSRATNSAMQERPQVPPTPVFAPPGRVSTKRRSGLPLVLVLVLLFLLIVGGLAAWLVVFQPFTVPAVTEPQQSFQNAGLGIALQYPNGWSARVDSKDGTVNFYDSTQTDQVNIAASPATGMSAAEYLQKQAKQAGLKSADPISFGGATWQQGQGSIMQSGASYIETLLVTIHGSHYFTITQLAPQATYADEEKIVFSSMRTSFHFLS